MTKARTLADFISDGSPLADGTISVSEVSGAAPLASPTFTGNIDAGDNVKLRLGNSDDLQIYHDTSSTYGEIASVIADTGSGPLKIAGGLTGRIELVNSAGDVMLQAVGQEEVNLYYNNAIKLATTSTGIDITGDVGATTATITGKTTTDELDLNAIAATIADTAVDIFVYDTRKDSDGGAWRKRTQGTSWYNETLNTATRGSRKEFPAVAVIVVHQLTSTGKVTIYDGDDPDMPMWMVLNGNAEASDLIPSFSTTSLSCVSALNGIILVGNGTYDIDSINFIEDSGYKWGTNNSKYLGNIQQRSAGLGFGSSIGTGIVNRAVNDVAMTVLPNAPIDAATGLPVPTIAVATNGGISIIHNNGSVSDITSSYGPTNRSSFVGFNGEEFLADLGTGADRSWMHTWASIPTLDTVVTVNNRTVSSGIAPTTWYDLSSLYGSDLYYLNNSGSEQFTAVEVIKNQGPVLCTNDGMSIIDEDLATPANGMVAYTTSSYNTGWMNGDIKLATLSDTDDTNVTGSELVTGDNSTFTSGIGDWSDPFYGTTPTNSGGYLTFNSTGSYMQARLAIASALTVGETYTLSFDNIAGIGVNFYATVEGTTITVTTAGVYTLTFVASSTTLQIDFKRAATSGTAQLDNVSVRLAEEDRSVNGNGLQVFGTVAKNPVATGADLVAYSGFSVSNYLELPHQSWMEIGTGDFCVMHWGKFTGTTASAFWQLGLPTDDTGDGSILALIVSGSLRLYARGNTGSETWENTTGFSINDGNWHHFTYIKRGRQLEVYQNGVLKDTEGLADRNYTEATSKIRLGLRTDPGGSYSALTAGSMALWRWSATLPSAEQIKKIYEDEKVLFQENAQATLYGSSDAVTALAYDDTTELLHVGTSAGRSVFQGLKRVDNTTTAVGAAISASNGLVADE